MYLIHEFFVKVIITILQIKTLYNVFAVHLLNEQNFSNFANFPDIFSSNLELPYDGHEGTDDKTSF